jgi:NAD(P)-dependent dehydrogenase (short-subunit alcohol dehydrogenase family)
MSGKTWFITGAARGIGAEIAKAALAAGHNVAATGRSIERLQAAFGGSGDALQVLELDVGDEAQSQRAVEAATARFGRIDVLVNNAGYGQLGLFEEIAPDDIERQFTTNVFGLMHVTRAVLPAMRRQRAGHVFNLSSLGGVSGDFEGASVYCATKFAVEGYSEGLAKEVAQFGIRVTVVEPGFTRTDFLDASSIRYGSRRIDDYADASARVRATYEQYNRRQQGDPAKLARLLVEVAETDAPPLHLPTGSDAAELIEGALARRLAEVRRWREKSASVDAGR